MHSCDARHQFAIARRRTAMGSWALAGCLAVAGCTAGETPGSLTASRHTPANGGPAASGQPAARRAPVWLQSLQMVSATAGWALRWSGDPNEPAPVTLGLAHTTDGGRTWSTVTPPTAKPLLTAQNSTAELLAKTADQAWLAVTHEAAQSSGSNPGTTKVFGTSDGGQSWTSSAPIQGGTGYASSLSFSDSTHGWLLQNLGAASGKNPVQLYRTLDAGHHWSLTAKTPILPQAAAGPSGLPLYCDKTGIAFATSTAGWITADCNVLADAVLVTHDGGRTWASQPLPLPTRTCQYGGCTVEPPQFFGSTGYLVVGRYPGPGYFLVSRHAGRTWSTAPLPRGSGAYPMVRFFDATHGLVIPVGPQGTIGRVFYATSDAGRSWQPVAQGGPVWQSGTTIEFVSAAAGFAWNMNATTPAIYATANGGRSWNRFVPVG